MILGDFIKRKWILIQWWIVNNWFADVRYKIKEERNLYEWRKGVLESQIFDLKDGNRVLRERVKAVESENESIRKVNKRKTVKALNTILESPSFRARMGEEIPEYLHIAAGDQYKQHKFSDEEKAFSLYKLAYEIVHGLSKYLEIYLDAHYDYESKQSSVITKVYVKPFQVAERTQPFAISPFAKFS